MAMGFMLVALDMVLIFIFGKRFRRNPWKAGTLEWAMPTPPPSYSFASIPHISERADNLPIDKLGAELAAGKGYLGFLRNGWMETIGVDAISGEPNQIIILPRPTYLPLFTAITTGGVFVSLLLKLYPVAVMFGLLTLGLFLLWTRNPDAKTDRGLLDASKDCRLPLHFESREAPTILAMRLVLIANATLFASLLFGGLFLWVSNLDPRPVTVVTSTWGASFVIPLALIATCVGALAGVKRASCKQMLIVSMVAYGAAASLLLVELHGRYEAATAQALDAVEFAVSSYLLLHLALGLVFSGFCLWRTRHYISGARQNDLRIGSLWNRYCLAIVVIAWLYPYLLTTLTPVG